MAQQVKAFSKPEDLSLFPGTHMKARAPVTYTYTHFIFIDII